MDVLALASTPKKENGVRIAKNVCGKQHFLSLKATLEAQTSDAASILLFNT